MAVNIYVVTDSKGVKALVRAKSKAAALAFKREQLVMTSELASQDDLVALLGSVEIENSETATDGAAS